MSAVSLSGQDTCPVDEIELRLALGWRLIAVDPLLIEPPKCLIETLAKLANVSDTAGSSRAQDEHEITPDSLANLAKLGGRP